MKYRKDDTIEYEYQKTRQKSIQIPEKKRHNCTKIPEKNIIRHKYQKNTIQLHTNTHKKYDIHYETRQSKRHERRTRTEITTNIRQRKSLRPRPTEKTKLRRSLQYLSNLKCASLLLYFYLFMRMTLLIMRMA